MRAESSVPTKFIPKALVERPNPFQVLGLGVLCVFVFIIYSRILELVSSRLYVASILFLLLAFTILLGGAIPYTLRSPVGRRMLLYTAWLFAVIPFSVWRGGSFGTVTQSWLRALLAFLALAGLIRSIRQSSRVIAVLGYAIGVLAMTSLIVGSTESGRLFLAQGKYSNPNDLAQALLMGLPCLMFVILKAPSLFHRALPFCLLLATLIAITKTGSRGAVVSFAVLAAFYLVSASTTTFRTLFVFVTVFVVAASLVVVSPATRKRYFTWFEAVEERVAPSGLITPDMTDLAVSSTESRKEILWMSIVLTLKHPLTGVGPGNFAVAENDEAIRSGRRKGRWLESHNTYTQVSSETGLPGLLLYVSVLWLCWKELRSARRLPAAGGQADWKLRHNITISLQGSLLAFAATSLFSSIAYQAMFPTVAGLIASFGLALRREMAADPQPQVAAPAPAPRSKARPAARLSPTPPAPSAPRG